MEGHLHAFSVLGGVPAGKIRYDNLKPAVSRVLGGRSRTESDQWVWFRSHAGFEAFYCMPGVDGAHEKGGVEGEIGRFRRNYLVPVPEIDTLAQLNARIDAVDIAEDARRIEGRVRTIGADFATEASLLAPLPDERFEPGRTLTPRVDRYGCVTVRQCYYSVPAKLIGNKSGCCCGPRRSSSSTGGSRSPGTSGRSRSGPGRWCSITTPRCCCANRAPPCWSRHARLACSPSRTRRSGRPRAPRTATPLAHGH